MAVTPEQQQIKDLKELRREFEQYRKEYESLSGKKFPNPFPNESLEQLINRLGGAENAFQAMQNQVRFVNQEIKSLDTNLDGVKSIVSDINRELEIQDDALKKAKQSYSKIRGIVGELEYISADITQYSKDDLKNLEKKNKRAFVGLKLKEKQLAAEIEASRGELSDAQISAGFGGKALKQKQELLGLTRDEADLQGDIQTVIDEQLMKISRINSAFGPLSKSLLGVGGLMGKLGFEKFAGVFKDAEEKMKVVAAEVTNSGEKAAGLVGAFKVLGTGLKTVFGPAGLLALGVGIFAKLVKTFNHLDQEAATLGKNLGLTRTSANEMLQSIEEAAVASGDMNLNTDRLLKAQTGISQSLGTTVRLTNQQLADQTYLAEFAGLQADELANSYKASLLVGKSQEAIFNTVVGQNDSIFSANELFKEAVNTTGQIAINLGNNPAAIAKAVAQAKRLGINLDTARSMADSTLDFESSIAAEMEAQILTGKSLNLNRARELAFQGDQVGAAKEMLRQVGSTEEFSSMNVLAQKSLAEAMGLSVDQLANQLREQEANAAIEKERQRLIAKNVDPREAELRAMAKNQTLGEVFNNIMSKLGDLVSKKILPVMQGISVAIGDGNEVMKTLKSTFSTAAGAAMDIFKPMDDTKYATASIIPSVEKIGDFLGRAFKFAVGIPEQFRKLKNSKTFQMISGLFSTKAGKLAIGGAAVGILGKMLTAKGTLKNPMIVSFAAGGILNTIADYLNPKAGSKGPKPKTSALGKVGATISGGIKALGSKLGSVMMKIPGASTVAKGAGAVMKGGKNVMGKMAGSGLAKGLGKVATKGFLKRIPILGSLVGVGYAIKRLTEGDYAGAAMEAGSAGLGLLDLVAPGVGTGLSLAADTAIAARDAGAFGGSEATPLATGGIVQQPTKALVGEAGAEAVIPLREFYAKFDQLIAAVNQGGDVMLDGVKVGNTLSLSSYKL